MSTERSAVLVIGWQCGDAESLTKHLAPIAEHYNIEHDDDDLHTVLTDSYADYFYKNMTNEVKKICNENEIEIVSGSDGGEDGSCYFGFGIPYVQGESIVDFLAMVHDISTALKNALEGIAISEPKVYNVVSWY